MPKKALGRNQTTLGVASGGQAAGPTLENKAGALEAVERGLAIEPGDHEFTVLREEIETGATLEQMEYHWINPGSGLETPDGVG